MKNIILILALVSTNLVFSQIHKDVPLLVEEDTTDIHWITSDSLLIMIEPLDNMEIEPLYEDISEGVFQVVFKNGRVTKCVFAEFYTLGYTEFCRIFVKENDEIIHKIFLRKEVEKIIKD